MAVRTTRLFVAGLVLTTLSVPGAGVAADGLDVAIGERLFRRAWVPAQASTRSADGLGPLFNARSCVACHAGLGRVDARAADALDRGLALRLGDGVGRPDPRFGRQIQTMAAPGVTPEPVPTLAWAAAPDRGRALVRPAAFLDGVTIRGSFRVAPALAGLGALEAVPDARILAIAAEQARSGTGVAGRPHRLADGRIGRFGWKATAASLADQVTDAFATDLGLSTARRPEPWGDCTAAQVNCRAAPHGTTTEEAVEMSSAIVERVTVYLAAQSLPDRTPRHEAAGAKLFAAIGCAVCHRPDLPDANRPAFTDLLLHDMGPGLDDGVGDGAARSAEWRTAPLAGLGAAEARGLLHDGRARSIAEAVAWHGGHAAGARDRFETLKPAERRVLLAYLRSL